VKVHLLNLREQQRKDRPHAGVVKGIVGNGYTFLRLKNQLTIKENGQPARNTKRGKVA